MIKNKYFPTEQVSGTMQPTGMCDVKYNGKTSPLAGMIENPSVQHLYWDLDGGSLLCHQKFVPSVNQSIIIKVQQIDKMWKESTCVTQCGDNGCQCVAKTQLKNVDHLILTGDNNLIVACLCGTFQSEGLPVSVRNWGPITLKYYVAHYTWSKKGFGFTASYAFNTDAVCDEHAYNTYSGTYVHTYNRFNLTRSCHQDNLLSKLR